MSVRSLSVRKRIYEIKNLSPKPNGCLIRGSDATDTPPPLAERQASTIIESAILEQQQKQKHSVSGSSLPTINDGDDTDDDDTFTIGIARDTSFYEGQEEPSKIKQTLTIALATVVNMREVPNDDTNKQLAEYVLKVFDTDDDTVRQQWRKASTQEKPELKLVCTVRSGSGLVAKDANGKSDPYVRIGIIDATRQGEDIVRRENLLDWKREGGVMPTGEVRVTSVQKATLNPRWNETLELRMGRADREMLVAEVWDSDKDMAPPTKVKGILHFVHDLRKTDDYMGRAFLSLWSLEQVQSKEMELFSHSGKSPYGSIIVDLSVEQVKKNTSLEVGMWEHMQLTHGIVNYEGRVGGQYRRKWRGELSEEAEKLLDKHAEFSGLGEAHKAAIRLSILIKYHRMFAVKMSTFSSLIQRISALAPEIAALEALGYTEGEVSHYDWIAVLITDLGELALDIEEVLKNHLTVLNIKDPKDLQRLKHRVDIMLQLYDFAPFVERIPEEKRSLSQLLEKCVQVAVPVWCLVLCANLMPDQNTPEMQLVAFKGLIEHILNHCKRVLQHINPIFQRAGVDYFTHFYLIMDKLILLEAMSKLEIRESPDAVTTYEVYRAIKEIKKLKKSIPKEHRQHLKIANFHTWFQSKVNQWINLATERCRSLIKKAIELDTVVQVTDDVQYSSSAVDGHSFLTLLMKLSDELEWPAKAEAFTFKISVVRSVCECALFYVSEVYNRLRPEDMFNQQGRFRATEKLSIVLNNMQHIKTVIVKHLKEHSLEQSGKKLTEEEQGIQTHSKEVMETLIQSAGEDIGTKIASIICQIISKMSPDITADIEAIVERKTPTTSLEMIDPLMSYLASNLQTLGNHLLTPVFQLILSDMWCMSSDCLQRVSDSTKKSSNRSQYYSKLRFILHSIRELFYSDGNGLDLECLDTDNYKALQYQLDILSLPTDKLILKFFSDLADIQTALINSGEDKYGKVLLSVGYHGDTEVIEVNLFQANKLPGLDTSGLSDPFVELTLTPPWHFGHTHSKKHKTPVKKKTLNPIFNEDIIMPASRELLQTRGAVILLTIFDHDIISSNDLCGVCVVPCEDIPILSPVRSAFDNPNAVERRNLTLPLFKIPESTIALNELSTRASSSDHRATDFLKENKQILADLDIDNPLLQQKLMTKHLRRIKSSATELASKLRRTMS
ncbi:protein unc-13 homolog D-like isoform X2 [Halichondria panicea]|uniref:protein unc-13 homolog D-like isoform X2 n=1 Tax=Halichondria panicea TaxID=6063 RepID=UPI00312B7CF2